jgi:hypothetical protein
VGEGFGAAGRLGVCVAGVWTRRAGVGDGFCCGAILELRLGRESWVLAETKLEPIRPAIANASASTTPKWRCFKALFSPLLERIL